MIFSQETVQYHLQLITVTASRINRHDLSETRGVVVLDQESIKNLPAESVSDLFKYGGGVDVQSRGIHAQADFSIRGSTFEQVLVLVDGVRMNDPQSGHHNSDIPVVLNEIDRIEIMPGHGSSLYGPDGFGGVIQIITKVPTKRQTRLEVQGGNFHTFGGYFSQAYRFGSLAGHCYIEKKKSNGYRPNTDFDQTLISQRFSLNSDPIQINGSFRYGMKDFGANNFYGNPNSREKTETAMANIGLQWCAHEILDMKIHFWYKNHDDDFIWDFQNSDNYRNDHRTSVFGFEFQGNMRPHNAFEAVIGFDGIHEGWQMQGLRNGQWEVEYNIWKVRNGFFLEGFWDMSSRWLADIALRYDYHRAWGQELNPSMSLRYQLSSLITCSGSVGRIFRAPTFTDLYYESPSDQGNSRLKPESGWSWEGRIKISGYKTETEWTLFSRNEKNGIDWIKGCEKDPWQAVNISTAEVIGIHFSGLFHLSSHFRIRNHYTFIEKKKKIGIYLSKYLFNYPKHQWMMLGIVTWPWGVDQSICLNFQYKNDKKEIWLFDTKLSKRWSHVSLFIDFKNIFDVYYEGIPGIPMPGRRILIGNEVLF